MKRRPLSILFISGILVSFLASPLCPAPAMNSERQSSMIRAEKARIEALLSPSVLKRVAAVSESSKQGLRGAKGATEISRFLSVSVGSQFPSAGTQDIEALALLVMFELWEQEESDLQEVLEDMGRMNEAKKIQQEYIDFLNKQKQEAQRLIGEEPIELKGQGVIEKNVALTDCRAERAKTKHFLIEYPRAPRLKRRGAITVPLPELETELRKAQRCLDRLNEILPEIDHIIQGWRESISQTEQALSSLAETVHNIGKSGIQRIR
jgi:hypothetical protein